MAASFLAIGMSTEDITTLTSELNIEKLLDGTLVSRAKGDRFRNVLDVIYMVQIKQQLASLAQPIPENLKRDYDALNRKIMRYEWALASNDLSINSIKEIIELSKSPTHLEKLDEALPMIPQPLQDAKGTTAPCQYFTFGDLRRLRELLPEENKTLIKQLSISVANETQGTVEYRGEATTPEETLAQAIQWSGAHPMYFRPGVNENGEQIADGGILDNMPEIPQEIGRTLYVRAETDASYKERKSAAETSADTTLSRPQRLFDAIVELSIGGGYFNGVANVRNREKIYYMEDSLLYLNAADVGTGSFSATGDQRKLVNKNASNQTLAFLKNQEKSFSHPLVALLYVHPKDRQDCWDDELDAHPSFGSAAQAAQKITQLQEKIIANLYTRDYEMTRSLSEKIIDILRQEVGDDTPEKQNMFELAKALCFKQVNHISHGKFCDHLENAKQDHWVIALLKIIFTPISLLFSFLLEETLPTPLKVKESRVVEPITEPMEQKLGSSGQEDKPLTSRDSKEESAYSLPESFGLGYPDGESESSSPNDSDLDHLDNKRPSPGG